MGDIGTPQLLMNLLVNEQQLPRSKDILTDTLWSIENLSFSEQNREKFLSGGIIQLYLRLISGEDEEIKAKAIMSLRTLGLLGKPFSTLVLVSYFPPNSSPESKCARGCQYCYNLETSFFHR